MADAGGTGPFRSWWLWLRVACDQGRWTVREWRVWPVRLAFK